MTILQKYVNEIVNMYTRIHPDVSVDKVRSMTNEFVMKSFKDIPCKMNNNVSHETIDTSVCEVTDWIETRQPIITGNGTFFKQHSEYLAPIIIMLESLKKQRSAVKKDMLACKKGSIEFINLNTQQGSIKVIMNAEYGGSGTQFSPFYSVYIPPATTGTAKNMTTTLICCLEFLSGNNDKWVKLKDINELFDMIIIVLNDEAESD